MGLSLLAITLFFIIVLPVAIFKIGYEEHVPLIKHDFSLPLEIRQFYLPVTIILILVTLLFRSFCSINTELISDLIIGNKAKVSELINVPTLLFVLVVYVTTYFTGFFKGHRKIESIKKHINNGAPLFEMADISLFGIWTATVYGKKNSVMIAVDVLTDGDILYSGDLYHYEAHDGLLNTITLKNTKRFLDDLNNIQGRNEKKYTIPGEFTYFFISKIKNVNVRKVVQEEDGIVFWGEKTRGNVESDPMFYKELQEKFLELQKLKK